MTESVEDVVIRDRDNVGIGLVVQLIINTNNKVSVLEEEVLLLKATMKTEKPYSGRKIMIVL